MISSRNLVSEALNSTGSKHFLVTECNLLKLVCSSNLNSINVGIPQGSILGPLSFIIFVKDLPDSVMCKTVMYADDTSLLDSYQTPMSLQNSLRS